MVTHTEIVQAPIATVWEHFLFKIAHPEHFVPGVSNVVMRETTPDHVIRAMDLALPDGSNATIVEKITHAPHRVKFEILEHPIYSGHVDNLAEAVTADSTRITFSLHWVDKATGVPYPHVETVKNAVLKTVGFIEGAGENL